MNRIFFFVLMIFATTIVYGAANDDYSDQKVSLTSPCERMTSVTTSNSATLDDVSRAIWVGGAGDIDVRMHEEGNDVTITGALAGTMISTRVDMIYNTTTATDLLNCH